MSLLPLFVVRIFTRHKLRTLKKMEHIKNAIDLAQFFMPSQMVVRSFYCVFYKLTVQPKQTTPQERV